jgi:hypothetical protein
MNSLTAYDEHRAQHAHELRRLDVESESGLTLLIAAVGALLLGAVPVFYSLAG